MNWGRDEQINELIELIIKFVRFAQELRGEGRITEEDYKLLVEKKIEFLRENNIPTSEYCEKEKTLKDLLAY